MRDAMQPSPGNRRPASPTGDSEPSCQESPARAAQAMDGFTPPGNGQLAAAGAAGDAIERSKKAYAANPQSARAALDYALCLFTHDGKDAAIPILRRIVAAGERHHYVLFVLAYALTECGIRGKSDSLLKEAVHCYTEILATRHDDSKTWNNLGMCLLYLQKINEAERCFLKAIQLEGDNAEHYNNIALVARLKNLPGLSVDCCKKAIALKPCYPDAYNNLGNALKDINDLEGAKTAYEKAFSLQPSPEFRCNLAMTLLSMGDLKTGWKLFESRKESNGFKSGALAGRIPQWRGQAAPGKTLFVSSEQGFGDTLQFCRYAAMAKEKGLAVRMRVQKPLVRLLQSLDGIDGVFAEPPAGAYDFQCPMMSLPLAFGTELDAIPYAGPYLRAPAADVRSWQDKLAGVAGFKVGLVWSGQSRRQLADFGLSHQQRSMPPEHFETLMGMDGIRFFNLQKDGPRSPGGLSMQDHMDACQDFADTAALVMNLDLVITVDTAMAHLAGALGKPVWVLNRFSGCWRWLRNREDSPWYPTLRLFTQAAPGDWAGVMARVKQALARVRGEAGGGEAETGVSCGERSCHTDGRRNGPGARKAG